MMGAHGPGSGRASNRVRGPFVRHALILVLPAVGALAQPEAPPGALRTDSRARYVHRITLYDREGQAIDPTDELAPPYSPKMTCGKCHAVGSVARGWHFNAPLDEHAGGGPAGRAGEPWLSWDEASRALTPLSGRHWPGVKAPREAGLSAWEFTLRFGRHTPGGGYGDLPAEAVAASDESRRWEISGPLEIDCLFCHSADNQHDPAEAARQIEKQNFQWAPTAALGLGVIRGEARHVPDDYNPFAPPNPDFPEQALPTVRYDLSRFDADQRVLFNLTRRPPVERCYFCHTTRAVGPQAAPRWQAPADVHIAAGMLCVDCHRNDIGHQITRGYPQEVNERGDAAIWALTCEGCHLGAALHATPAGGVRESLPPDRAEAAAQRPESAQAAAPRPEWALGGAFAAPRPEHRGLPPVHFEKLTCTACHSGPWPAAYATRVQTSMAHGLGLPRKERTDDEAPEIVAPIFARDAQGRIGPQRMVWPQGAGDGAAEGSEKDGDQGAERDADAGDSTAPAPYLWPLAHDVRPAAQSLGVRGCADCHAADAPLFFGAVAARDDGSPRPIGRMIELQGGDERLARGWALSFRGRTAFKWLAGACLALVAVAMLSWIGRQNRIANGE